FTVLADQSLSLFDQALLEHLLSPLVDTAVQDRALRIESESQNSEADQRVSSLFPKFRHFLSRCEAHLDRPDQLGSVVGMNLLGRSVIEAPQNTVQIMRAALCNSLPQALSQLLRALRAGEESFQQRSQIQARASDDDGQAASRFDLFQTLACLS